MGLGLLTDLYELNMAASYLRRGMDVSATFSLFVRGLPSQRGFAVSAGLEDCLDYLEALRFDDTDLAYLRELGFRQDDVERFASLRFTGEAWAVPEGRMVFAGEPVLEVTAPIAEAQLGETYLLNQITLHTTLASKAARCRIAAGDRDVVDFAFRRTHGLDAAMAVARTTAMCGFAATSNVEAARRFGLRAAGTMAHSYIEAFATERDAFRAFAQDFPGRVTFLVDTYDTAGGVDAAIDVIRELGLGGVRAVAPIDAFGVGTRLGVSADAPYLDTVYKLVEVDGRPVAKLSTGKATWPGRKQVFRGSRPGHDVIGLRDEPAPEGTGPLLERVMAAGRRTGPPGTLEAARGRFEEDLAALPEVVRRLDRPEAQIPPPSDALRDLAERVESGHR